MTKEIREWEDKEDYTDLVERLKYYADTAEDMIYGVCVNAPEAMKAAADAIEQLSTKCRQLEKERDAAVRDLKTFGNVCFICRDHDSCYSEFRGVSPKCGTMDNGHWEWRGVMENNDERTE